MLKNKVVWTSGLVALVIAIVLGTINYKVSAQQTIAATSMHVQSAASEIWWPMIPAAEPYKPITGQHLKEYVNEITTMTQSSRHDSQYWGRIAGFPSSEEAQNWVEAKFRQIGLTVQKQMVDLPPQWVPKSWTVKASSGGKTVDLGSIWPYLNSPGTTGGGLDLDAVWVGVGTDADFAGKDVRGKAAVIYSWPAPGAFRHSAMWLGAMKRAEDQGAAAVLVVLALPGNSQAATGFGFPRGAKAPIFIMGDDDGTALRKLIEQASPGQPVKVHVQLDVQMVSGLKTWNVTGILPGQTDENILVTAHTDSYFEGADDNATGMAAMVALAEYYSKIPKEKRRRAMYFVATPDHHAGGNGAKWEHEHMQDFFKKTALILNCEHLAMTMRYWWMGNDATNGSVLTLADTNAIHPQWWYVNGSERMRSMFINDLTMFGVASYIEPMTSSLGDIVSIHLDAPSADVIDAQTDYHTNLDIPSIVPDAGIERVARAYAKFIDDVNTLSLKETLPPTPVQTSQANIGGGDD